MHGIVENDILGCLIACIHSLDSEGITDLFCRNTLVIVNRQDAEGKRAATLIVSYIKMLAQNADAFCIIPEKYREESLTENIQQVFISGRIELKYGLRVCDYELDVNCIMCDDGICTLHSTVNESLGKRHVIVTKDSIVCKKERDIRLVESWRNYVIWHCDDGSYREKIALYKVSRALSSRFIEVRKSHWVNSDYILGIKKREMNVIGEDNPIVIPVERLKKVKDKIRHEE